MTVGPQLSLSTTRGQPVRRLEAAVEVACQNWIYGEFERSKNAASNSESLVPRLLNDRPNCDCKKPARHSLSVAFKRSQCTHLELPCRSRRRSPPLAPIRQAFPS